MRQRDPGIRRARGASSGDYLLAFWSKLRTREFRKSGEKNIRVGYKKKKLTACGMITFPKAPSFLKQKPY